jgi:hypothetical protein
VKYAVVSVLISIAFESQAFAVLRPLFPTKPEPPFSSEAIDLAKQVTAHHWQTEPGNKSAAAPNPCRLLVSPPRAQGASSTFNFELREKPWQEGLNNSRESFCARFHGLAHRCGG